MGKNIQDPKTIEEHFNNVKFQCDSVAGCLSINDNFSASIKVECLIDAAKQLLDQMKKEDEEIAKRSPLFDI